ncbi:hypothetical protein ACFWBF_18035 [Streptomyces sp. NPDC060028]|uniref:hypothetical protein n=1 Tax=Streptomyces sp. NPDC060028 TaxID=3347041 RepID=UPI0036A6B69F
MTDYTPHRDDRGEEALDALLARDQASLLVAVRAVLDVEGGLERLGSAKGGVARPYVTVQNTGSEVAGDRSDWQSFEVEAVLDGPALQGALGMIDDLAGEMCDAADDLREEMYAEHLDPSRPTPYDLLELTMEALLEVSDRLSARDLTELELTREFEPMQRVFKDEAEYWRQPDRDFVEPGRADVCFSRALRFSRFHAKLVTLHAQLRWLFEKAKDPSLLAP